MGRPYTIGYYDDSLSLGGTSRYLLELLDGLPRDTFRPVFFAPVRSAWHQFLEARGVEIVLLNDAPAAAPASSASGATVTAAVPAASAATVSSASTASARSAARKKPLLPTSVAWTLGLAGEIRSLIRLFKKRPVDLLHSNNFGPEPAPIAARLAGCPKVVAFFQVDSTYDFGQRSSWRYRKLERWCLSSCDHAIAPTENTKQDWIRRTGLESYQDKTTVIHYGVPLDRVQRRRSIPEAKAALGLPPDAMVVASLGRLEGHKGYEYLIRATPAILRDFPMAKILIGGKGPLDAELRALAVQLNVADAYRFLGFVGEIRDVLEPADIYIQPSLCETTGIALLEAGCLCVPLAGSRIGGIPDVIVDGVDGLLFPDRDPAAIANAVTKLLRDPALRAKLGKAARERVRDEFDPAAMCAATSRLYLKILGEA